MTENLVDQYKNLFAEASGGKEGFYQTNASRYRTGEIDIKAPYTRDHYEYYRPSDAIPKGDNQYELQTIMSICYSAYEKSGIIKSVIDMMSEFGSEGISIVHEDEGPNKFYQDWARQINLEDRAERFLSWIFKSGNVVVRRKYGRISSPRITNLKEKNPSIDYGNIPLDYIFYNPATIELIGDDLSVFSAEKKYGIKISQTSVSKYIKQPKNDVERQIFDKLPQELKDAINKKATNKNYYIVEIPKDKIYVGHYKKDDHQIWAKPLVYGVLSDIQYNDKIKLAKISSLDGFINVTRLWKLGDHTKDIMPLPQAGSKLAGILANNTGNGGMDIIWDSMIDLQEFYPPIENLANFSEDTSSILLGLGIPESLIGSKEATGKGSSGANSINLKTLVKKLEAGRRELRKWLEAEISIIQERMGFRKRPVIQFKNSNLFDEQIYFKMILDLVDRNILSEERVLQILSESSDIEISRIQKESSMREDGKKPNKASPYYNPQLPDQQKHEINKIKVSDKLSNKNNPASEQKDNTNNLSKEKLKEPRDRGRPPGSNDKVKRTRRTRAEKIHLGYEIYDKISELTNQIYLNYYKVENARQFTSKQKEEIEYAKIKLISQIKDPDVHISLESVYNNFDESLSLKFSQFLEEYLDKTQFKALNNEQKKALIVSAYIDMYLEV